MAHAGAQMPVRRGAVPGIQPPPIGHVRRPRMFNVTREAGQTLGEQIAAHYAERVSQRLLLPGAKLPSVREAAMRHGVSTSTVVAAYDLMLARGLIDAKPQRGYFVRTVPQRPERSARGQGHGDGPLPTPIDATSLIRSMFHQHVRESTPGMGTLPSQWLDLPLLHTSLRRAMRDESKGLASLRYGDPAGDDRLRQNVALRLGDLGVAVDATQVVTTVGATHALEVVARTLWRPGDAVLVDEPGWAVEYARLSRMGLRLLPVPRDEHGPDLDVMRALMAAHRPRAYVTVSVLHNPTGASLSASVAHRVLQLAHEHDVWIVEDDTYAQLAGPHGPRLSALDGLRRTIYIGGFSKIVAPGWRVGYLAASPAMVNTLIDTKLLGGLTSPSLLERAMAHAIEQGLLRRHTDRVVGKLAAARARTQRLVLDAGCRFLSPPQGIFGWIDVGVDTEALAQPMLDLGWLIAPGRLFHVDGRPSTAMRINFATSQDLKFWRALEGARDRLVRR